MLRVESKASLDDGMGLPWERNFFRGACLFVAQGADSPGSKVSSPLRRGRTFVEVERFVEGVFS